MMTMMVLLLIHTLVAVSFVIVIGVDSGKTL